MSPINSIAITGFDLIFDPSTQFSTSSLLTGKAFAADYSEPTPSNLTTAISDMETAFTDAAGRAIPDETELGFGNLSGMTLEPGLYKWGTGVLITSSLTFWQGLDPVEGSVTYTGVTATFTPYNRLELDAVYTAMVSVAVNDLAGNALGNDHVWNFTTGTEPVTNLWEEGGDAGDGWLFFDWFG